MTKKQLIFSKQDRILDAMLDKDYSGLSDLIHPDASVFGTALHEIEYEEAREEVRRETEDRRPGSEKSKVKSEK